MIAASSDEATTPLYPHDCDSCTFLGQYTNDDAVYDLYYHAPADRPLLETVVARYGPDSDYLSGLRHAEHLQPLAVARQRAQDRGLL